MNHTQHISTGIQNLKGNEILAMIQQTEEGTMVAIKPLCAALKLSWGGQFERIQGDPRFNYSDIRMVGADGKQREMICLPAEQVPMWINSINSNKVAEEKRAALLELHKFFGFALNEFTRGRYVTQEQYMRDMDELKEQLRIAMATIDALTNTNQALWKVKGFEASAASYEMHAAKERKKVVDLIQ